MFDYSGWLIAGIISGYKTGEVSFCKTTERTDKYLELGKITQAQAIEIAMACPKPEEVIEEEIIEEPETPVIDETLIEEEIDEGEGT
jgi:hypothetical protein